MKMSFGWFLLVVHFWIDNVKGCSVMPLDIWIEDVYLLDIDNTSLLVETSNNTCYLFNVDNQIQSYQVLCEDFIDYYRDFTPFDIDPTTTSITSITLNEQSSISTDGSYIDIAMKRNGESLTITSYFIPEIIETEHERINYLFWTINQYNVTIILIQSIVDMAIAIHFDIKNNNNNNFNTTNNNNNNTDSNNNKYIIKTIELKGNDDVYYGVYSNVGKKAVGQPVIESLNLVSLDIFMYACYNNIYSIYNLWFETDSHNNNNNNNNKLIKSIELNNLGAAYLVIDIKHKKAYDYIGVLISDYLHTYTFSDENENIIEPKNDTMTYYVESYHIDFEVPFDDTIYPSTTAYYTTTATTIATTTITTTTTQETIDTTNSPDTTNNPDTTEAAYITTAEITDVKDTTDSPDSSDTSESTSDSADTIRITEIRETRNTNTNSSSGFGFNTDIFGSDTDDSDETDEAISIKNTKLIACEKIIYCCILALLMSDIF